MTVGEQNPLELFGPATRTWFGETFAAPTRVQREGWPAIASGAHVLMLAPTGSGKTLAAFLSCLDRLSRRTPAAEDPGVRLLYISPLKALAYDIERNLRAPLVGLQRVAALQGRALAPLRVDVRTGDTSARERRRQAREPSEILITTPESLYLLLGSAARETLRTVETVIVDEIHALAPNKRGAHLALSLERLAHLARHDPQRVGLSATQRPLDLVARFLGGDRPVTIVDASEPPRLELTITAAVPEMTAPGRRPASGSLLGAGDPLGPEARSSIWPAIYPELLRLIQAHRSTIVFVNSRRLAERLAQQLNEAAGDELARAHHGSIARAQRQAVEEQLKAGGLRAIVATSSLELGIDMGAVDLVIQIESPGSVARGLQRIGRAGHAVGDVSRGRIFPKYRGDLLESSVVARRMLDGEVEPIRVPRNTLDVLAQQIVAMVAMDDWSVDQIESLSRRTHSFSQLSREALIEVLDMLSGRYPSDELADLRPRVVWDRQSDRVRARPGAKLVSLVSGGTIPDRGTFAVHLGPKGPRVGELDEEMVHESRAGETFLLGASTWRIEEITRDRVLVSPAPGEPGKMPFWRGAGPGRPIELGRAMGAFLRELGSLSAPAARSLLRQRYLLDELAAGNLVAYLAEQREATETLPTDRALTIERFRDELGDWRICILSCFGARVHAPWALALEAQLSQRAGFEVHAFWTDDGIALRFADTDELPDVETLLPDPDELERLVVDQLARSALFASHFRENAARALLLPRRGPGRRTPLWSQRLRAQRLMAVAMQYPSFPIVLETFRECLQDVFDLPALGELLRQIRGRLVRVDEVETRAASPFARALAFDYVAAYLYEGDAPLAERKAQALTLDRNLLRDLLGHDELRDLLDAEVIAEVEGELQALAPGHRARHADALHDLLRRLGDLTLAEAQARCKGNAATWIAELETERRVVSVRLGGEPRLIAAEDAGRYRDALGVALPPGLPAAFLEAGEAPLERLLLRWARRHGPFVTATVAARFGLPSAQLEPVLRLLGRRDQLLLGEFHPMGTQPEWCHPEVLRTLRRRTLARLRDRVAPVEPAALGRFLPAWHGVGAGRAGLGALREAVVQLEGLPLPFSELESRILPARVSDYRPALLDELGTTGELVWIGQGALSPTDGRVVLCRRERASLLLEPPPEGPPAPFDGPLHQRLIELLEGRGATFLAALQQHCGEVPARQLLEALWDLVWAGLVTNDTFQPLRDLRARRRSSRRNRARGAIGGRWSAVSELVDRGLDPTKRWHARAQMLLDRHGLVTRESATAEGLAGGFALVGQVLRAMEETGKIRRGYFVDGLHGLQFAHAGAVDRLRALAGDMEGEVLALAATDPANPYGAAVPWPATSGDHGARPSRRAGASVILVSGRAALYLHAGRQRLQTFADLSDDDLGRAVKDGLSALLHQQRRRSLRLTEIDGLPATRCPLAPLLEHAGFTRGYQELVGDRIHIRNSS